MYFYIFNFLFFFIILLFTFMYNKSNINILFLFQMSSYPNNNPIIINDDVPVYFGSHGKGKGGRVRRSSNRKRNRRIIKMVQACLLRKYNFYFLI